MMISYVEISVTYFEKLLNECSVVLSDSSRSVVGRQFPADVAEQKFWGAVFYLPLRILYPLQAVGSEIFTQLHLFTLKIFIFSEKAST